MRKSTKIGLVISSAAAIILAGSIMAGGTYALFTSESNVNISVNSGAVDVKAYIDTNSLKTYSGKTNSLTGVPADDEVNIITTDVNGDFTNGGTAKINTDGDLELKKVTPGDKVTFNIKLENKSNVKIKYRTIISCGEDDGLFSGLSFKINESEYDGLSNKSVWSTLEANTNFSTATIPVEVILPTDASNAYQDTSCKVTYAIEAVQGNAETNDPEENVIEIHNARELGYFRDKVNSSVVKNEDGNYIDKDNKQQLTFENKTVKLMDNINLNSINWTPIRWINSCGFTFDGNEKTISYFTASERLDDTNNKAVGLFAYATGATIKNLNVDHATINGINHSAAIVGNALCTMIENCNVTNSTITSSTWKDPSEVSSSNPEGWNDGDKAGAIAGYLSAESTAWVKNCTVESCEIDGYRDIGGVVGYAGGAAVVSGNNVNNTKIINNRSNNYKGYTSDNQYDVNKIVGEKSAASTIDNNGDTNVTIEVSYAAGFNYELSTGKFYITSKEGLFNFASYVNSGNKMTGKIVELRTNVDLENDLWTPINYFEGTFDGLGKTISNLKIRNNSVYENGAYGPSCVGLFGYCCNPEANVLIKNFTLTNVDIDGIYWVGSIIGNGIGTIEDVTVNGNVKIIASNYNVGYWVGGIAGYFYGQFNNCKIDANVGSCVTAYVYNSWYVGGIVGFTGEQNYAKYIKNCSVINLNITGKYCIGGIAGCLHQNMNIDGCTVKDCEINGSEGTGVFYGRLIEGGVCDESKNVKNNVKVNGTLA